MSTNGKPTGAILYARFSPRPNPRAKGDGRPGHDCESVQTQLERLRAWCAALGLEILGEFSDEEMSGKKKENRPGLQAAMLKACRLRAVLCVYSMSRLARNTRDAIDIAETLTRHRANLSSIHERIDTSTPWGRFSYTMLAGLAQLEREQIVERTSDAMLRHQGAGRRMGRVDRCPFGWRASGVPDGKLEADEQEQAIIARIVALRASGESYRSICRVLDQEGIGRRDGKTWATCPGMIPVILRRSGVLG